MSNSKANSEQVGGTHYQAEYQHWDFVKDLNMHYLIANATKYVSRYNKKNGLQDLKKAVHYVDKAIEVFSAVREKNLEKLKKFNSANNFTDKQQQIMFISFLASTYDLQPLVSMKQEILDLIASLESPPKEDSKGQKQQAGFDIERDAPNYSKAD